MSEIPHQHVPPETLRAYRDGRTGAAETLAVSDALAECAGCRGALAALPSVPAYEEIAAAADRGLDPAASGAFDDDPAARAELADLLAFRREMAGHADRNYGPGPDLGKDVTGGKIIPLPQIFLRRKSFAALTAAAALVLLAGGWWMFVQTGVDGERRLLSDGHGRRVTLAELPADLREAVRSTLRDGRLPVAPMVARLHTTAGTLAGATDAAAFRVVSPVGIVQRDPQPTLRWTARKGAESYKVILLDTENGQELHAGLPATATQWTFPSLVPGHTYEWQVEAAAGDEIIGRTPKPPAPEARFRVLGEAERNELARIEALYGQYPLVLATAYARAGLVTEEAAALARLVREHPQSALAQQLRASGPTAQRQPE